MALTDLMHELESFYFEVKSKEGAAAHLYIGSNTWRGWTSYPKKDSYVKDTLIAAYHELTEPLHAFLDAHPEPSRVAFDDLHRRLVDTLYTFTQTRNSVIKVFPSSLGDYHGKAYNAYTKVVSLTINHACLHKNPQTGEIKYPAERHLALINCLHVPLDEHVTAGVAGEVAKKTMPVPGFRLVPGGMGTIKSEGQYYQHQTYLRTVADQIPSRLFEGHSVAPVVFDSFFSLKAGAARGV